MVGLSEEVVDLVSSPHESQLGSMIVEGDCGVKILVQEKEGL